MINDAELNVVSNPIVMGVLDTNLKLDQIVRQAEQMMSDGASIIDVAGCCESTRPGAVKVTVQEELDRVIPIIEKLSEHISVPISVATSNPEVMIAAASAGAKMINDVLALSKPGAINAAVKLRMPVCLMHIPRGMSSMQTDPVYKDVVSEVFAYLTQRVAQCVAEGIAPKNIIIDPGFGFGKNLQHNLNLLRSLQVFKSLHYPLLVGLSNKSFIGQILDATIDQRIYGSIAAAVIAISKGADIIRAHDVKATVDAINILKAVQK